MNEYDLRELVIQTARNYMGCKESDGSHRKIIDLYNSHSPLARGHKMDYETDPWCAAFVSAISIECGLTDVMPTECSCGKMIDLYKALDGWIESDHYIPAPGDVIMYDWDDSGEGDNKGAPEHTGIVVNIAGDRITVLEGNYNDAVNDRELKVNGKYIRGYCIPQYGKSGKITFITVLEFQQAAIKDGFAFPKYGADGKWGNECASVAKKAIVKQRVSYTFPHLTKLVQRAVGATVDGKCGPATREAIIHYQKAHRLAADGEVGINTWKKILGVE